MNYFATFQYDRHFHSTGEQTSIGKIQESCKVSTRSRIEEKDIV